MTDDTHTEWRERLDAGEDMIDLFDEYQDEIARYRAALESICNVGDRAAVMVAQAALDYA